MRNVKAPKIVTIAILSLITTVMWIIFSVISTIVKPSKLDVPNEVVEPLDPSLDTGVLNSLPDRTYFSQGSTILTPVETIEPTAEPTTTPEASPESSTQSASLQTQ